MNDVCCAPTRHEPNLLFTNNYDVPEATVDSALPHLWRMLAVHVIPVVCPFQGVHFGLVQWNQYPAPPFLWHSSRCYDLAEPTCR